jgi:hypothetical protein
MRHWGLYFSCGAAASPTSTCEERVKLVKRHAVSNMVDCLFRIKQKKHVSHGTAVSQKNNVRWSRGISTTMEFQVGLGARSIDYCTTTSLR